MNNSKDISYIIALAIALLTTEIGNRIGDCLTNNSIFPYPKLAVILTVTIMFIAGYYFIKLVDKMLLNRFKNKLNELFFYLILCVLFILVVLTQSSLNLSNESDKLKLSKQNCETSLTN